MVKISQEELFWKPDQGTDQADQGTDQANQAIKLVDYIATFKDLNQEEKIFWKEKAQVLMYQILYNYRGKIGLQIVYKMLYCQMDGIRKKLYWEMNMVHTPLVRKKR